MTDAAGRRDIVILARRTPDATVLGDADTLGATSLLVIAIGWPLQEGQRAVLDRAIDLARGAGLSFEAVLVASPRGVGTELRARDRILVVGSPRERRRLDRVLRSVSAAGARTP